ncbi:carbohydrate kinase family protein [Mucilaginibacter limnophilus]|uniref:Carbohydrate kinase family protein n=1 Tax=Mucilaginibacter limnophilus TaxID=1932778 RepID=A0A3S2WZU5_9SPHI|nr:carbohydrate kinase family protein [Mucilaginibacter limnophilus]RVU02049.1 carbohydrate kinase family protein [Mucilaginibacter limnophilus]
MKREGILVGGNWIVDQVKIIDKYPSQEALSTILSQESSNGGSAYNISKNLRKMQVPFPVEAIGLVGTDSRGNSIIKECGKLNIDTRQLTQIKEAGTSYTDVMSVKSTGKRTFFHYRGANSLLDVPHFDFTASQAKIFHLGYLLLLDKLDAVNNGTTGAAQVLKAAQEQGFITTVDLVSEDSDRFASIIPLALPYTDYLFLNEFEAWMLSGVNTITGNNEISIEKCYLAAEKILEMGVNRWVIIHFPDATLAVNAQGEKVYQSSLKVPSERIAGCVGAGDAFAAGVLMGIHEEWNMQQCLNLGVCVAASSMAKATCSESVKPYNECLKLAHVYGHRTAATAVAI